jgi:hypothetical protein
MTQILYKLQSNINKDISTIINNLDAEKLILFILQDREYLFSPILRELSLNDNKESLLECYSYILSEIITTQKINYLKLFDFNISDFIRDNEDKLTELTNLSLTRKKIKDFTIYVTKQDYKLEIKDNVITLSHDIENYMKYYNIGYLRFSLSNLHLSMMSFANKKFDVEDVILKAYEQKFKFSELIDEGTPLARIRFNFSNLLFNILSSILTPESEYKMNSAFHDYFINNNVNIEDQCFKSSSIRWIDLLKFAMITGGLSTLMQKVIKEKSNGDKLIVDNSVLFAYTYSMLLEVFSLIFKSINSNIKGKDIKKFIDAFTTDLTSPKGTLDIQFRPIIKIEEDTYYVSFNLFSRINIIRAYITNLNISLDDQGTKFERYVKKLLEKHFSNIISNKKFKNSEGTEGEIDICFLGDKSIYFFECKNRLHPISSNTSISNYEYIMKAKNIQLPRVIKYFEDDKKAFVKKYFDKDIKNINEYTVYKFILLSNRNVSGLNIDDIAIRDIYSLERILETGYLEIGQLSDGEGEKEIVNYEKIYYWENKKSFKENDLINYHSEKSKFFDLFKRIIFETTRDYSYNEYTLRDQIFSSNLSVDQLDNIKKKLKSNKSSK